MPARRMFVMLLFLASFGFAQVPSDAQFWLTPDDRVTDKSGELVSAIEKDRQHYTARFFTRGQWLEYRFAPHTDRILSITGADTTEEYLYDARNAYAGKNIHFDGRLLTVRKEQRDRFRAGDMPAIELKREDGDRVVAISSGTMTIAEIHSVDGHADSVHLGSGVDLSIQPQSQGGYRELLTDSNGHVLDDRTITNTATRRPAEDVQLDIVAADLGLLNTWRTAVTTQYNATGSVQVVKDEHGKTVMYLVHDGVFAAGFDRAGKAIYYDVAVDLYVGRVANPAGWAELAALVPDHFTLTRDGRSGAYVRGPALNAIEGVWSGRDQSGKTFIRFRHSAPQGGVTTPSRTAPSDAGNSAGSALAKAVRSLRPAPNDFCIIDYTITTYGDGTRVINITDVTCFYFGSGGSGGGTTGGGSGSGYSSNQTSGILNGSRQRAG